MVAALSLPLLLLSLLLFSGPALSVRTADLSAGGSALVQSDDGVLSSEAAASGKDYQCCCKHGGCNEKHNYAVTHFSYSEKRCCKVTYSNVVGYKCPMYGYTEHDAKACHVPQICPVGAKFSVSSRRCVCGSGMEGKVDYDWFSNSWRKPRCTTKKCPANAIGAPVCRCTDGHFGKLQWKESGWSGVCEPVMCPTNSERKTTGGPCKCKEGYHGSLKWMEEGYYEGDCDPSMCPENTHRSGSASCLCDDGWTGDGFNWDGNGFSGFCDKVPCPAKTSNHPNCYCDGWLEGDVFWSVDTWVGSCGCPEDSHDSDKGCVCNKGFEGDLSFEEGDLDFSKIFDSKGFCSEEKCPRGAEGHPDCACKEGYKGSLRWDEGGQSWEGDCVVP